MLTSEHIAHKHPAFVLTNTRQIYHAACLDSGKTTRGLHYVIFQCAPPKSISFYILLQRHEPTQYAPIPSLHRGSVKSRQQLLQETTTLSLYQPSYLVQEHFIICKTWKQCSITVQNTFDMRRSKKICSDVE